MNELFIDDLIEGLETVTSTNVYVCTQKTILKTLDDNECREKFPMICYEYTPDSNVEVDPSESKFLNDSSHNGTWLVGCDDDNVVFLLCLKSKPGGVEIDTIEINSDMRGEKLGERIVCTIETIAYDNLYTYISVSPFDTDAMNFWEHMEYVEDMRGNWIKSLIA